MAFTAGTRIGPYEITAQIGAGGMGEVYRATDTNLKRAVAIKVLPAVVAADAERLARFQREAEVLAALNHPNIAAIYGLERSGDTIALVMELVDGPTLAERIAAGAIPWSEASPLALQLAEALDYAHEHGIIHRDLKPANIKLTPDGIVKVLDFGLAKALTADPTGPESMLRAANSPTITSPAMTLRGTILGTAAYMSPEQARGGTVDKRSDIWAFGVVVFEMLTGGRCFDGPSMTDVLASVVRSEPAWALLPADVPERGRALLRRCLKKDVRARLRDIGDARLELAETADNEPGESARASGGQAGRDLTWRSRAWRLAPWVLAIAGLAVAAVSWRAPASSAPTAGTRRFGLLLPESAPLEFVGEANPGSGQTALALSRDGTLLAYVSPWKDTTRLSLHDLRSGATRTLDTTDGAYHPFFSPTGEWVAFFAGHQLKKVNVTSGEVVTVARAPNPYGGDWGDNNTIVVNVSDGNDVILVDPDGRIRSIPPPPGAQRKASWLGGPVFPRFLPGSEWVLGRACGEVQRLCARSVRSGEVRLLRLGTAVSPLEAGDGGLLGTSPVYVASGHLVYARAADGAVVAVPFDPVSLTAGGAEVSVLPGVRREGSISGALQMVVGRDGTVIWAMGSDARTNQFVWVDAAGRREPLPIPPGAFGEFKLSPSRRWLAAIVTGITGHPELRVFDLQRQGVSFQWSDPAFASIWLTWWPDETAIGLTSTDGVARLVRRDGTGAAPEIGVGVYPDDVLSDSTFIARAPETQPDGRTLWPLAIGKLPADNTLPAPITLLQNRLVRDHTYTFAPSLSPDRKWLTFTSNASGPYEVYVVREPFTGAATRISIDGGEVGRWAPDGRLFYRNNRRWYFVEPTGNDAEPFTEPKFFVRGNFDNVFGVDYAISADSRRLLVLQGPPDEQARSLNVITNWFDELRRVAPGPGGNP